MEMHNKDQTSFNEGSSIHPHVNNAVGYISRSRWQKFKPAGFNENSDVPRTVCHTVMSKGLGWPNHKIKDAIGTEASLLRLIRNSVDWLEIIFKNWGNNLLVHQWFSWICEHYTNYFHFIIIRWLHFRGITKNQFSRANICP